MRPVMGISWDRQLPAGSFFFVTSRKSRLEAGGPRDIVLFQHHPAKGLARSVCREHAHCNA
jgi:hypothetical protein